jgi:hypothetical protein
LADSTEAEKIRGAQTEEDGILGNVCSPWKNHGRSLKYRSIYTQEDYLK